MLINAEGRALRGKSPVNLSDGKVEVMSLGFLGHNDGHFGLGLADAAVFFGSVIEKRHVSNFLY